MKTFQIKMQETSERGDRSDVLWQVKMVGCSLARKIEPNDKEIIIQAPDTFNHLVVQGMQGVEEIKEVATY